MQHLFCGAPSGIDDVAVKPKKASRHRRCVTDISETDSVFGKGRMDEDRLTLLTEEIAPSESC